MPFRVARARALKSNMRCLILSPTILAIFVLFAGDVRSQEGEKKPQSFQSRKDASIIYFKEEPSAPQEPPPAPPEPVEPTVGDFLTADWDADDFVVLRINSVSENGNRYMVRGMKTLKDTLDTIVVTGKVQKKDVDVQRNTTVKALENLKVETLGGTDDGLAVDLPDGGRLSLLYVADPHTAREFSLQDNAPADRRRGRRELAVFSAWKPGGGDLSAIALPAHWGTRSGRGVILGLRLAGPNKQPDRLSLFPRHWTFMEYVPVEEAVGSDRTDQMLALLVGLQDRPGEKAHDFSFIIPYGDWEPIPKEQVRVFDDDKEGLSELLKHPNRNYSELSVLLQKTKREGRSVGYEWTTQFAVALDDWENDRFQPYSVRAVFIDREGKEVPMRSLSSISSETGPSGENLYLLKGFHFSGTNKSVGVRFERRAYYRCEFQGISPAPDKGTKPSVSFKDFPLEENR